MAEAVNQQALARWRLILGAAAAGELDRYGSGGQVELSDDELIMDRALAAIYDQTAEGGEGASGSGAGARGAGQGKSAPRLAQWLGDVRTFFRRRGVRYPE